MKRSKARMTGVIRKIVARKGTTGKMIERKIARREPPARWERNAPRAPTSGKANSHGMKTTAMGGCPQERIQGVWPKTRPISTVPFKMKKRSCVTTERDWVSATRHIERVKVNSPGSQSCVTRLDMTFSFLHAV